ncbi:uncharacterized protein METZ01_LOCUS233875, partial [marine metagenome]
MSSLPKNKYLELIYRLDKVLTDDAKASTLG